MFFKFSNRIMGLKYGRAEGLDSRRAILLREVLLFLLRMLAAVLSRLIVVGVRSVGRHKLGVTAARSLQPKPL